MADNRRRKDDVWKRAARVRGKDPNKYRKDPYGNELYRGSYGKNSAMGWEIDHIRPQSRGGSDRLSNLQALNTRKNRSLGDSTSKRSRHRRPRGFRASRRF